MVWEVVGDRGGLGTWGSRGGGGFSLRGSLEEPSAAWWEGLGGAPSRGPEHRLLREEKWGGEPWRSKGGDEGAGQGERRAEGGAGRGGKRGAEELRELGLGAGGAEERAEELGERRGP